MLNKRGLRRLPWGTPQRIGVQLEQLLLYITLCFRSCKNDLSSLRAVSRRPYAFNFASSRLWQIQSRALDKSIATTPTSCFSSRDFLQSSVSFISAVAVECPLRKPDMLGEKVGKNEEYNKSNNTFSNSLEMAGRTLTGG